MRQVDVKRELRAHAAGTAAGTLSGGYSSYIGLSDIAVHRSVGGLDKASVYYAAAVGALFLFAYPLSSAVGGMPSLVIAAICVYIGVDFLWSNLVTASRENGAGSALAALAVLGLCVWKDMLTGSLVGIAAFQAAGGWRRRAEKRE